MSLTPTGLNFRRRSSLDNVLIQSGLCLQRPLHGFQIGMKVEAVDKRNPMLIRAATIVDTEDHRLKVQGPPPPPAPLCPATPLCSPLIRSNLFSSRCILTAGIQSTIIGWRPTGLICTLLAGVKKQATHCSTLTVRNCPLPVNEVAKVTFSSYCRL